MGSKEGAGKKEEAGRSLGGLRKNLDLFFDLFESYESDLEFLRRNPGCLLQMGNWIHPTKAVRLREKAKRARDIMGMIAASIELGLSSSYHQEREPEKPA